MRRIVLSTICLFLAGIFVWQAGSFVSGHDHEVSKPVINQQGGVNKLSSAAAINGAGEVYDGFPALTGRVVDTASMLSGAEKTSLESSLAAFESASSDQIVVATLASLNGNNLEDYANRLFRFWQLGQAEENNGVLLLIARDDRKIRIEVGYGLEGVLTDVLSKIIIDQVIVPQFRAGNFGQGIVEGTDMIVKVLSGDAAELEARKNRNNNIDSEDVVTIVIFTLWGILFFGSFGFALLAPVFGKKIGKKKYRWLGIDIHYSSGSRGGRSSGSYGGGWSGGSSGGSFSGGGGSSGGGGASGGW